MGVFFSTNTGDMFLYFSQNRASESERPLCGVAVINAPHGAVGEEDERRNARQNRLDRSNSRYFISSCCCGKREKPTTSLLRPGEVIISHGAKGELLSLISIPLDVLGGRHGTINSLPAQHTFLASAEHHPNWPYVRALHTTSSLNGTHEKIAFPTSTQDVKPFTFTRSKLHLLGRYLFYTHETGSPQLDSIALVWDILRVGSAFLSLRRYTS